jgi:hypothetical protein
MPVASLIVWSAELGIPAPTETEQRTLEQLRRPGLGRHLRTITARLRGYPDPAYLPPQGWMDQLYRQASGNVILIAERK